MSKYEKRGVPKTSTGRGAGIRVNCSTRRKFFVKDRTKDYRVSPTPDGADLKKTSANFLVTFATGKPQAFQKGPFHVPAS
ncbi:predicted protein [Histoplasma mississippiense (nom. inval.)]|uniref:predicted protein n=1 Tax=Ajellomyces capsulatus (strain NAm1 / WU24) TaxID=2059318 RepID=UPI000157C971|nr:predicted protein [Histoplasma mississippiense (nom. inval.)]EDN09463.1 predicted protein [Histoplasma mississippiense (nom. inval.)]